LRAVVAVPDQTEVHLHANKDVEYKAVAAVLASAQRIGIKKLAITGNEQFDN
jgi:biopolymer transport protein ExbD